MMDKFKSALLQTLPVAVWVGLSAGITYILTALLHRPDLAPYYGVLNMLLVFINEFQK